MSAQEIPEPAARPAAQTAPTAEAGAGPQLGEGGPAEPNDGVRQPAATDSLEELQQRVAELDDRWRRAVADLDNTRKRHVRESEQQRWQERARVAAAWLPVLDSLDMALDHAAADPTSVVEGVRAVREQALNVLSGLGYPRREDVGETFDPNRHEAVATTSHSGAAPGTVIQVMRPGYGEGERQLRPAAVVVAAAPSVERTPVSGETHTSARSNPSHRGAAGRQ
jgi:molecular chaperone GrpE